MIYMKEIKTNIKQEVNNILGILITYKDADGTVWYLESDIQRILVAGRKCRNTRGINSVKVDLSDADFDSSKDTRKQGVFISREDVIYVFKVSTLRSFYKQEFARWILSIDPLSQEEQKELNRFQVFTHDTFGSLLTYTDDDGTIWYFGRDLHKLFCNPSVTTNLLQLERKKSTRKYVTRLTISPAIILLHPDIHIAKYGFAKLQQGLFTTKEMLSRFTHSGYSAKTLRKEVYQWIIEITANSTSDGNC